MTTVRLVRCTDENDLHEMLEDLQSSGLRVRPWRQGYLASKEYNGVWWLYILWGIFTYGIGSVLYFLYCRKLAGKGDRIYVRMAQGVPTRMQL